MTGDTRRDPPVLAGGPHRGGRVTEAAGVNQRGDAGPAAPGTASDLEEDRSVTGERPPEHGARTRAPDRQRAEVLAAYGGRCASCGEDDPGLLVVEGIGQVPGANRGQRYAWLRANGYPAYHDGGLIGLVCRACWHPIGLVRGVLAASRGYPGYNNRPPACARPGLPAGLGA